MRKNPSTDSLEQGKPVYAVDGTGVQELRTQTFRLRDLFLEMGRRQPLRDLLSASVDMPELTAPQMHVLVWLGHDVALTMGELARRLGITEKTVTGIVDRLEQAGHVLRERATDDRRVVRVHLTEAGSDCFHRLDSQVTEKMVRILGMLDAADRDQLFGILKKLHDRIVARASAAAGMETK